MLNHMSQYGSEKYLLSPSTTWHQNKIIQSGSEMKAPARLAAVSCYVIQGHQKFSIEKRAPAIETEVTFFRLTSLMCSRFWYFSL